MPSPAVLNCPGGFSWFYVDLVDDQGRGATVIWSWGLPFLPGYARAARTGRPELPADRPSVNVVVYGGGRERFYLLSELPREQCSWGADGRSWRLGDCSFRWVDDPNGASGESVTTRALEGTIDLALPTGGRVTGRLRLSGALRRDTDRDDPDHNHPDRDHPDRNHPERDHPDRDHPDRYSRGDPVGPHLWTPMLASSRGCLELHTPSGDFRVAGRGYHDRNSAAQPLHGLGIQSWWWGRLALPGRDLIFYRLTPSEPGAALRDLVVELSEDGSCRVRENAGLKTGRLRRSPWGLRWPSSAAFPDPDGRPVRVQIRALLDNGPFYQRYLLQGSCGGEEGNGIEEGYGIGEHLVPARVDSDLLRPLVRMRVHRAVGPNSIWLPLFSGDSEGRWGRLLGRPGDVRA